MFGIDDAALAALIAAAAEAAAASAATSAAAGTAAAGVGAGVGAGALGAEAALGAGALGAGAAGAGELAGAAAAPALLAPEAGAAAYGASTAPSLLAPEAAAPTFSQAPAAGGFMEVPGGAATPGGGFGGGSFDPGAEFGAGQFGAPQSGGFQMPEWATMENARNAGTLAYGGAQVGSAVMPKPKPAGAPSPIVGGEGSSKPTGEAALKSLVDRMAMRSQEQKRKQGGYF